MAALRFYGYAFSVYARTVKAVLHEKDTAYVYIETDPFSEDLNEEYASLHPFGRVPALRHGEISLYETIAITHYLDARFPSPALRPTDPLALAKMLQVMSITDSYAYWPLVRQVFAHRVFAPRIGQPVDEDEVKAGLANAANVLAALEKICATGKGLNAREPSLADFHLAPMLDYFKQAKEGARMLKSYPTLSAWFNLVQKRPSLKNSRPTLP
ncbi:MAG: glutathione S-transferase family protein [Pseudomonadota bacterium]